MKFKFYLFILLILMFLTSFINAQEYSIYQIRKGDNLTSISKHFGISLSELIKINDIKNPDLIVIGQKIKIPLQGLQYIVRKGDCLWKIANKFKVSIKSIIKSNNLNKPDKIYVGQRLHIPKNPENKHYQLASRSYRLNYIWPVQGKLSSKFGWRLHPVRNKKEFHTGIDISVPYGTPVYAAEEGKIIFSGRSKGYGNLIIIKHRNNSLTYYGHNLKLIVKKGDYIHQGKVIALSGNSGISTGPHLHFEIKINGHHIDPLKYLNTNYLYNNFRI